jgi:cell division protein FtsN
VTTSGPTQLYKVQVGRYRERSEAQKIQARLKGEEQFDSLIVR